MVGVQKLKTMRIFCVGVHYHILSSSVLLTTLENGPQPTLVAAQMLTSYSVFGIRPLRVMFVLLASRTVMSELVSFPTSK